jgi:spore coat polysaccharide biosynthesis predicted glycosyltransferase SpsG
VAIGPVAPSNSGGPGAEIGLTGPEYALLDPAFAVLDPGPTPDLVGCLLISVGQRDSANAASLCLEALHRLFERGMRIRARLCIGSGAPHLAKLRQRIDTLDDQVELVLDTPRLIEEMAAAEMMIGAGGVTLLERLAAGLPSLSIEVADNQRLLLNWASGKEATVNAGPLATLTAEALADHVATLCGDPRRRRNMSKIGRSLIDGRGAERVADSLISYAANRAPEIGSSVTSLNGSVIG